MVILIAIESINACLCVNELIRLAHAANMHVKHDLVLSRLINTMIYGASACATVVIFKV